MDKLILQYVKYENDEKTDIYHGKYFQPKSFCVHDMPFAQKTLETTSKNNLK